MFSLQSTWTVCNFSIVKILLKNILTEYRKFNFGWTIRLNSSLVLSTPTFNSLRNFRAVSDTIKDTYSHHFQNVLCSTLWQDTRRKQSIIIRLEYCVKTLARSITAYWLWQQPIQWAMLPSSLKWEYTALSDFPAGRNSSRPDRKLAWEGER